MSQSVKARLADIYADLLPNQRLDSKMLNYWSTALGKAEKSYGDFVSFVLKSPDYINHNKSIFVDVFYEYASCLPEGLEANAMFDDVMTSFDGMAISRQDMRRYIVTSPAFVTSCGDLVRKLYKAARQSDPEADTVNAYIQKFWNDPAYNVDALQRDITTPSAPPAVTQSPSPPSDVPVTVFAASTTAPVSSTPSTPSPHGPPGVDKEAAKQCIDLYETIFERGMNAREYVQFIDALVALPSPGAQQKRIEAIKADMRDAFVKVQDTLHRYLAQDITDLDFMREHLSPWLADKDYTNTLVKDIIASDAYRQKMTAKIAALHETMYGEPIPHEDAAYLFNKIRARGLELVNEDLNREIQAFKDETDTYVQHIFDLYLDVYEREPDNDELTTHLKLVRDVGADAASASIKKDLRNALEYHDMIKKKIRKAYANVGITASPSAIYKVLELVLPFREDDRIDARIEEHVRG
jgi:hypothetical protein